MFYPLNARVAVLTTCLFIFAASVVMPANPAASEEVDAARPPASPVSKSYRKAVSKLLDLSGAKIAGEQMAYAMAQETLGAIASTGIEISEQIQSVVVEEALSEFNTSIGDLDYLTDVYTPLYAEHFSEKEIEELLAFYESPIGAKAIAALPIVGQGAMLSIQQQSMTRVPVFQEKVDKRLREAGVIVAP